MDDDGPLLLAIKSAGNYCSASALVLALRCHQTSRVTIKHDFRHFKPNLRLLLCGVLTAFQDYLNCLCQT